MPNPADAILERLLARLPSGQSHIHIDELSATGVPDFIIARIERDIHRKISAEFSLPDTIWTDVENKRDRKSTRLNSSHVAISYAVFCLKKKKNKHKIICM